jgi:hypothetical protein
MMREAGRAVEEDMGVFYREGRKGREIILRGYFLIELVGAGLPPISFYSRSIGDMSPPTWGLNFSGAFGIS